MRIFGFISSWENRQKQNLRLGMLFLDCRDNASGTLRDILRLVFTVVGSDHKHKELSLVTLKFTVLHAPQNMLCAVATIAEVKNLIPLFQFGEMFNALTAFALPAVRNRVADENDIVFLRTRKNLVALL